MELPLRLQLKPSRCYFMFLASGHILAGVAVCFLPLPLALPLRGGLLLALGLLMLKRWHAVSRRLPELLLRADGRLEIGAPGAAVLADVGTDTLVWPGLVILHLRLETARCAPLVLFPDALQGAEMHRRLRIWLRWRALA